MLNCSCILGVIPTWSWHMILLICCWIWLLIFCWKCLHVYSSGILAVVFFSCSVFFLKILLILEGEEERRGRDRGEKRRTNILHTERRAQHIALSQDPEIMPEPKPRVVHSSDWATQVLLVVCVWFFLKIFICLCDRETASERGNTAGEWERKKQAPSKGAQCGTRSRNAGITPWAEGRCLMTALPRRPWNE